MNRLPPIRRWGVAALTGVTLFGGLSIVGAGVASAATTPTVSAALTTNATAQTIAGSKTAAQNGASLTLTVTGAISAGDKIVLTLACPTAGTASFANATISSTHFGTAAVTANQSGSTCSTLTFTEATTGTNDSIVFTPSFVTSDVPSQALAITGLYEVFGGATSFTVPTVANVAWFSVSSNSPAVTLPQSGTTSISNITVTDPGNLPSGSIATGDSITFTLPQGDTWSGTPTVTASPTGTVAPTATFSGNVLTVVAGTAATAGVGNSLTLSNLSVATTSGSSGSALGEQDVAINNVTQSLVIAPAVSVGTILGSVTRIAGADGTADGTVAAEFEAAYPYNSVGTGGNRNVVLATDAPHTNGSDALAASYLEGKLGTGLLITSPTILGADAQNAIRFEGVNTVYVVGGPLAVSPAVLAQIRTLPVYNPGGLTTTGKLVTVVGPIYGADGTPEGTAAKIATYFNSYGSVNVSGAYSSKGGLYNDTTGNASASAANGSLSTAIVVASSDWQDAMSIAPEAFNQKFPVVLAGPSTSTTLGADAKAALTSLAVKQVIVIGGQFALQNSVETQIAALNGGISVLRIAGIDATDTAAQIANFALAASTAGLALSGSHTVMASHVDYWADALGSAALGGGANGSFGFEPLILVENPTTVGSYTTAALPVLRAAPGSVIGLTVLGGPLAMPTSTVNALLAGL